MDRTGIGCALTVLAIGVAKTTCSRTTNSPIRPSCKLDPEALRPMLGVELNYLHATLDEINARSGSVESYLSDVLGVGVTQRENLSNKLSV